MRIDANLMRRVMWVIWPLKRFTPAQATPLLSRTAPDATTAAIRSPRRGVGAAAATSEVGRRLSASATGLLQGIRV